MCGYQPWNRLSVLQEERRCLSFVLSLSLSPCSDADVRKSFSILISSRLLLIDLSPGHPRSLTSLPLQRLF